MQKQATTPYVSPLQCSYSPKTQTLDASNLIKGITDMNETTTIKRSISTQ